MNLKLSIDFLTGRAAKPGPLLASPGEAVAIVATWSQPLPEGAEIALFTNVGVQAKSMGETPGTRLSANSFSFATTLDGPVLERAQALQPGQRVGGTFVIRYKIAIVSRWSHAVFFEIEP